MAKNDFKSVDEYIASQSAAAQEVLNLVRTTIRKALPKAEEVISYKMPTYKLGGRAVLYCAAWKQHYSLYPVSAGLIDVIRDETASFTVEKGTIRFPLSQPVPVRLIARIAKLRAKELAERKAPKPAGAKKG